LTALTVFAATVVLNWDFYRLLARVRGWGFAASAAPLHTLYFLYSGVAFIAGLVSYGWQALSGIERAGRALGEQAAKDAESHR